VLACCLIDRLRIGGQLVVEAVEVNPLAALYEPLFVGAPEVEVPQHGTEDDLVPVTNARQRCIDHNPASEEGYDAVIRHGPVDDRRVIVKRLAVSRRLLVASPDYLRRAGRPTSLSDLEQHKGIVYSARGASDWRFRTGRKYMTVRPVIALRVNNGLLMREAAIAGLGVALLPTFLLDAPMRERTLRVIDVGAEGEGATVHIAYPEHLRASGKIRALTAWLQDAFGDPAYWDDATR
jgi:DNA-binding transcriptional LysR family regulator